MAATRLIAMHINKGKTLAQCLEARTDYAQNPEKTEKGNLISAYECDPMTCDEEFLLSKRQYRQFTGREQKGDVIAYQIRQSFKPGEVTAEEANRIGYELAMAITKGKHAFIVATHTDRPHYHNHIIFNSTSLDCLHKFRDFKHSGLALQHISDRICLEHGLSVIEPKPYKDRLRRSKYPKRPRLRDDICNAIDKALEQKPKNFEEFLSFLEAAGYEIKRGKQIALKGKDQQRFIRLRSLGDGYTEESYGESGYGAGGYEEPSYSEPAPAVQPIEYGSSMGSIYQTTGYDSSPYQSASAGASEKSEAISQAYGGSKLGSGAYMGGSTGAPRVGRSVGNIGGYVDETMVNTSSYGSDPYGGTPLPKLGEAGVGGAGIFTIDSNGGFGSSGASTIGGGTFGSGSPVILANEL